MAETRAAVPAAWARDACAGADPWDAAAMTAWRVGGTVVWSPSSIRSSSGAG